MLGRTHMAIGAAGAALASPLVLQSKWVNIGQLFQGNWGQAPHALGAEAVIVSAAVAGSLIPDLDQSDSKMAHKIERFGQVVMFALLAALIVLVHAQTSWAAWAAALFLSWILGARSNLARLLGLGVIGGGILAWGIQHPPQLLGAILLAIWIAGSMFTAHRTFTHSIGGLGVLIWGLYSLLWQVPHGEPLWHHAIIGTSIGYALHIVADAFAGGVPLLWPVKKRQGTRLVKTGSPWDYMIGGLSVFACVALIAFR